MKKLILLLAAAFVFSGCTKTTEVHQVYPPETTVTSETVRTPPKNDENPLARKDIPVKVRVHDAGFPRSLKKSSSRTIRTAFRRCSANMTTLFSKTISFSIRRMPIRPAPRISQLMKLPLLCITEALSSTSP